MKIHTNNKAFGKIATILLFLPLIISTTACDEEGIFGNLDPERQYINAFAEAEATVINSFMLADRARRDTAVQNSGSGIILSDIQASVTDGILTVSFGTAGSSEPDGILRIGSFTVEETGDFTSAGGSLTFETSAEFTIKGQALYYHFTVTNTGSGEFEVLVDSLQLAERYVLNATKTIYWENPFAAHVTASNRSWDASGQSTFTDTQEEVTANINIGATHKWHYSDSCQYKMVSGEASVVLDQEFNNTEQLEFDFMGENGCSNLMRIRSIDKDEFIYQPIIGF